MKKMLMVTMLFGLLAAPASGALKATINTGNANRAAGFNGGPFTATDASTGGDVLPDSGFDTFCIETNEFVSNGTYFVKIDTAAMNGGTGGPNPDPISNATAYLYFTYRTNPTALNSGVSGGFNFNTPGSASFKQAARQLQEAIWHLEQETGGVSNGLVTLALGSGWSSIGNVRVMQLWTGYNATTGVYSGASQDMLIIVPAPGAVLLGMLGLSTIGWIRRRRNSVI